MNMTTVEVEIDRVYTSMLSRIEGHNSEIVED